MEHNQRFDQYKKGLNNTIIFIKHSNLYKSLITLVKKQGFAGAKLNKEIKMGFFGLKIYLKAKNWRKNAGYRIYSINRPGRLLNFQHFQQV